VQPPPPTAMAASEEHTGPGETQEKKGTMPTPPSHTNALSLLSVNTKPCMFVAPLRVPTAVHATAPAEVGSDPATPTMPSASGVVAYSVP